MEEPRLTDGRLKIRHLTLADALSAQGSLVAAAAQLHVSQPALTRTLRELEAIVGVELFERRARGVVPTIYGSAFTDYARRILGSLNQAGRHIAELADARAGTVSVGIESFGGHAVVAAAIAQVKAGNPGLIVVALEGGGEYLLDGVQSGQLDCAVGCFGDMRHRDELKLRRFPDEPIALVVRRGHSLGRRSKVELGSLIDSAWVLPTHPTALRAEFDFALERAGLSVPANRIETDSAAALVSIVTATDAIGVMVRSTAVGHPALHLLAPSIVEAELDVGVVTPRDRPAGPASRAFGRAVLDAAWRLAADLDRA